MRRLKNLLLNAFLVSAVCSYADPHADAVYAQIRDLKHPTQADYRLIQNYLTFGNRPFLYRLKDYEQRAKDIKIIGRRPREVPRSGSVAVNCAPNDRNRCVLVYSSFNERYPQGLERLVDLIKHSDFKGHVLYRVGGWPDVEGGSLTLAHLPYAFKVCYFKEAERLGFKRVFWLDAAIVPLVSLNDIFQTIEEQGYFTVGNTHSVGQHFNTYAAAAMGITVEAAAQMPACSVGILGFDLTNERAKKTLDRWYEITKTSEEASYSSRPELNIISVILNQMEMTEWLDLGRTAGSKTRIQPSTVFWIDRAFVH
ncbi:MAG TPA: hypothetical protein VIJ46_04450 [Rhabdochlamydiaceae bacterium]